jgi:hypothetical protein
MPQFFFVLATPCIVKNSNLKAFIKIWSARNGGCAGRTGEIPEIDVIFVFLNRKAPF